MDELSGRQASWRFDGETVTIRYQGGWFKDHLLRALGQCELPVAAIASVDFRPNPGKKSGWMLRLHLRDRADPFAAVGAMLSETSQPFWLVGSSKSELVAEYLADQIAFAAEQARESGAELPVDFATRLVPRLPAHIQTAEGTAAFDGSTVRLVWSGSAASSVKKRQQRREYPIEQISSVEWGPSDGWEYGHLRIVGPGIEDSGAKPKHDFACLLCDEGEEGAAVLLMAATITAHLWAREAEGRQPAALEAADSGAGGEAASNDWVYAQIRRLSELHAEGILTDEEFTAKKAELLDRI